MNESDDSSAPSPLPPNDPDGDKENLRNFVDVKVTFDYMAEDIENGYYEEPMNKRKTLVQLGESVYANKLSPSIRESFELLYKTSDGFCLDKTTTIDELPIEDEVREVTICLVYKRITNIIEKRTCVCSHHEWNTYSDAAARMLSQLVPNPRWAGNLKGARSRGRNVSQSEEPGKENQLIARQNFSANDTLAELKGHISLASELPNRSSDGGSLFLYGNIGRGNRFVGVDIANKMIVIDSSNPTNQVKMIRRSCSPNASFLHLVGENGRIGIILVAQEDIAEGSEILVVFDRDTTLQETPLDCVEHAGNIDECPFEEQRRTIAHMRAFKKQKLTAQNHSGGQENA